MARNSINSLKSKIRLATGALAFFVAAFGVGSWLLIWLIAENSIYTAFVQIAAAASAIWFGGWWLSGEVVRPIEKIALLAKSLERGNQVSLPKTSGARETDELLEILHRSNRQIQNLVGLMDKVSGGNTEIALAPLEQNDRLSDSFRRLLGKVTESIAAKHDLEQIQTAIRRISLEIAPIKNGVFDAEITHDNRHLREISETLIFLMQRLNELVEQVKNESGQTQTFAAEIRRTLQDVIGADEERIRKMRQAHQTLQQIPQTVRNVSEELFASSQTARQSIKSARDGSKTAQQNLAAVNTLRGQMRDTWKRFGHLSERCEEIGAAARTINDLAQKTDLIRFNVALPPPENSGRGEANRFAVEITRLAERARAAHEQISTLHKTFRLEINEIENALRDTTGEAANLSRYAIETGNSLNELEKYINRFLNLQEKLVASSGAQSADAETAFQTVGASLETSENAVGSLREAKNRTARAAAAMGNLQFAVNAYKTLPNAARSNAPITAEPVEFAPEARLLDAKRAAD